MTKGVGAVDYDEIQALLRMTQQSNPFVARIASATLAMVESKRDAEVRAACAEAALARERQTIAHIRQILGDGTGDADMMLRQISYILGE
jgi:hypothetical protein